MGFKFKMNFAAWKDYYKTNFWMYFVLWRCWKTKFKARSLMACMVRRGSKLVVPEGSWVRFRQLGGGGLSPRVGGG